MWTARSPPVSPVSINARLQGHVLSGRNIPVSGSDAHLWHVSYQVKPLDSFYQSKQMCVYIILCTENFPFCSARFVVASILCHSSLWRCSVPLLPQPPRLPWAGVPANRITPGVQREPLRPLAPNYGLLPDSNNNYHLLETTSSCQGI